MTELAHCFYLANLFFYNNYNQCYKIKKKNKNAISKENTPGQ